MQMMAGKKHVRAGWLKHPLTLIAAGLILLAFGWWLSDRLDRHNTNYVYGVSFSQKYAQELGLDWRQAYSDILNELPFQKIRLMSYWDLIEPAPEQYNFDDLDWQFAEANQHSTKVSLSVGLRQPRWPECHQPDWATRLSQHARNQQLLNYLQAVVNRYKNNPALDSWQLENEALNTLFGECKDYDRQRLNDEFSLLKQLDPNHPVIMNLSDQHGLPVRGPVPDIYGFSVYRVFYNQLGYHGYIIYPTPIWYHRLRAGVIKLLHNRPVIIHELQAEPWGPKPITQLNEAEQAKSMNAQQLRQNTAFAQKLGIPEMYLWGAEYWYWRKTQFNDPSLWNAVKDIVSQ